jgi:hypothetical protein
VIINVCGVTIYVEEENWQELSAYGRLKILKGAAIIEDAIRRGVKKPAKLGNGELSKKIKHLR